MGNWTLTTPEDFDRIITTPDTIDVIKITEINVSLGFDEDEAAECAAKLLGIGYVVLPRGVKALSMDIVLDYGFIDSGFNTVRREEVSIDDTSTNNIFTTPTTSGTINSNLQNAIWDELETLGLIPPGSR